MRIWEAAGTCGYSICDMRGVAEGHNAPILLLCASMEGEIKDVIAVVARSASEYATPINVSFGESLMLGGVADVLLELFFYYLELESK